MFSTHPTVYSAQIWRTIAAVSADWQVLSIHNYLQESFSHLHSKGVTIFVLSSKLFGRRVLGPLDFLQRACKIGKNYQDPLKNTESDKSYDKK